MKTAISFLTAALIAFSPPLFIGNVIEHSGMLGAAFGYLCILVLPYAYTIALFGFRAHEQRLLTIKSHWGELIAAGCITAVAIDNTYDSFPIFLYGAILAAVKSAAVVSACEMENHP